MGEAYDIFKSYVVEKFESYFGEGQSTFFLPLYDPILILFEWVGSDKKKDDTIIKSNSYAAFVEWALNKDNGTFSRHMESGVVPLGQDGKTIVAEICLILAMKYEGITKMNKGQLITKGIELAEQSLSTSYAAGELCKFARNE